VFVNAAGLLGMCGHGTIGLAVTLAEAGRIGIGEHRFETPVGVVAARVVGDGSVEIDNVPSFRYRTAVALDVDGRAVVGDVAWGGNWFYIVETERHLDAAEPDTLLAETKRIRAALLRAGVVGSDGAPIDHVALIERRARDGREPRNFVLCPNDAYDRSPCGTGTSARLACLAAAKELRPEVRITQRSFIGSRFDAWYRPDPSAADRVLPTIRGRAWIVAEGTLRLDETDPSRGGGWHESH
jgi:4-hydroxyproline epimerase